MTLKNLAKAPFPWFGGKSKAAPLVWSLFGDVPHYVEPFFGSGAVLLNRPHPCNRPYISETVNDLDGLVVNFWRAIQWHPDATAEAASWPVSENDKHARQIALVRWREDRLAEKLAGSPEWCDPVMAGWWAWGVSVQIGAFAVGNGPWTADETGRIVRQKAEPGVSRGLPHLGNDGQGVNRPGTREPGVIDVNSQEFHPITMPELVRWFAYLAARLRHVRILNGDWSRLVTDGASKHLPVRQGKGPVGVFLDPPYADTAERADDLYASDSFDVAHDVRRWCLEHGDDPERRIILAGFDGEHGTELVDAGWTEHEWFVAGHLTGGMANVGADAHQQHRERLWSSPHCLTPASALQGSLFDEEDNQ